MKHIVLTVMFSFFTSLIYCQNNPISFKHFEVSGLSFISKKNEIMRVLGKPQAVVEPKYECGFFSEEEQGKKFYSLQYSNLIFTGNASQGYQLEKVVFNNKRDHNIRYKGTRITFRTTKGEMETIFGTKVGRNEITLSERKGETKIVFTFKNGLLSEMRYWTPC
jgi:hypothetical protein